MLARRPVALIVALTIGLGALAGCGSDDAAEDGNLGDSTTTAASAPAAPATEAAPRENTQPDDADASGPSADYEAYDVCLRVPRPIQQAIAAGIKPETGVTLSGFRAFRSEDFERIWMVGAALNGPGLDGSDVAVWATNQFRDPPDFTGLIFSADGFAKEFSDYGDRGGEFSSVDQGVEEVRNCVRDA